MIQNIIALIIVAAAAGVTVYSVYRSITVKDKSICGGCPSCELKNELKKKGKLVPYVGNQKNRKFQFTIDELKFPAKT